MNAHKVCGAGRTLSQIMHATLVAGTYKDRHPPHQFGVIRTGNWKCVRLSVLGGDRVMNGVGKASGLQGATLSGPLQLLLPV